MSGQKGEGGRGGGGWERAVIWMLLPEFVKVKMSKVM